MALGWPRHAVSSIDLGLFVLPQTFTHQSIYCVLPLTLLKATTSGANQRTHPARPPAPIRLFCKWAGVVFIAWAGCFFSSSIWPVLLLSIDCGSGKARCGVHSLRTELAVVESAVYPTDLRSLCACDCNGTVRNQNRSQVSFVCNVLLCCGLSDTQEAWPSSASP